MSDLYDGATFDAAWQACADVRDSYPRDVDDAPSGEVVDAILDAAAPLIAAKALRDAGSEMRIGWGDLLRPDGSVFRGAQHHPDDGSRAVPLHEWLVDRADAIERGAS